MGKSSSAAPLNTAVVVGVLAVTLLAAGMNFNGSLIEWSGRHHRAGGIPGRTDLSGRGVRIDGLAFDAVPVVRADVLAVDRLSQRSSRGVWPGSASRALVGLWAGFAAGLDCGPAGSGCCSLGMPVPGMPQPLASLGMPSRWGELGELVDGADSDLPLVS